MYITRSYVGNPKHFFRLPQQFTNTHLHSSIVIVSFAAVIRVVTQSSPQWGESIVLYDEQ